MLRFSKIASCFWLLLLVSGCMRGASDAKDEPRVIEQATVIFEENYIIEQSAVSRSGVMTCPNNRRCMNTPLLPPRPCAQPMPTYYDNIPEDMFAQGVLLIHPMTRVKVLCLNQQGQSAVACAEQFRAQGYVLATDIPQFAGRYDFLQKNTYPSRRWRKGENAPRW